jgi:tRNA (guanine37-N1)-methyltransferase
VPEVLLSGHHARIERWRLESSLMRTFVNRPDLLQDRPMSPEETAILSGGQAGLRRLLGCAAAEEAPPPGARKSRRERG